MTNHTDIDLELSDEEMHLYSRQILLEGWDIDAQEKLKFANILIIGCGGIGCTTAELLARAGVGKITLIDADTIEISNLQRQIAYVEENIGFYKGFRTRDRIIHMTFGSKMNYIMKLIFLKQFLYKIAITNIALNESISGMIFNFSDIF